MKLAILGHFILCIFSLNALGANDSLDMWSTAPLEDTTYSAEEIAGESEKLLAWLATNYLSLTDEEKAEPREKLYNLIDAHIKQLYQSSGMFAFAKDDALLEQLFFWSEKLGAYGGALTYNAIKSSAAPAQEQTLAPPDGFSITLNQGLYQIRSTEKNWAVQIPYNFMLTTITKFTAGNGAQTEILVFSFGSTKDDGAATPSRASIMLVHSPGTKKRTFSTYWKDQFEIPRNAERVELGVNNMTSLKKYDSDADLQVELTLWSADAGQFAISYTGSKKACAENRPHFINILEGLEI